MNTDYYFLYCKKCNEKVQLHANYLQSNSINKFFDFTLKHTDDKDNRCTEKLEIIVEKSIPWDKVNSAKESKKVNMNKDILPCPFCGNNDLLLLIFVKCKSCGAMGGMADFENIDDITSITNLAIKKWNKRHDPWIKENKHEK